MEVRAGMPDGGIVKIILTADWQLDDQEKNRYRWDVFEWMQKLQKEQGAEELYVLGDIVDRKDRLTNEFLLQFKYCIEEYLRGFSRIVFLVGNHDYARNPNHTALSLFESDRLKVVTDTRWDWGDRLFVANGCCNHFSDPIEGAQIVFMHETVRGSLADDMKTGLLESAGADLSKLLRNVPFVFAGDIHGHQVIQLKNKAKTKWIYTGAPHPVRFGEMWEPQCILLDLDGDEIKWKSIKRDMKACSEKHTFEVAPDAEPEDIIKEHCKPGDHVRIIVQMEETSHELFSETCAAWTKALGNALCLFDSAQWTVGEVIREIDEKASTDEEVFDDFCEKSKLDKPTRDEGRDILQGRS